MTLHKALTFLAVVLAAAGCAAPTPPPPTERHPGDLRPAGVLNTDVVTRVALDRLTVAPAGGMSGYERKRFGTPWRDTDGNGCNQRDDVLSRDASTVRHDNERQPCMITSIMLLDPYTGDHLARTRDIQPDHVVALATAWRSGASAWSDAHRERFATDKSNLLAVSGLVNQSKGDQTPDTWKPPRRESWCLYAKIYVTTSDSYRLSITAPVKDALVTMLDTCGG